MATIKCNKCGEDNHFQITTSMAKEQTMFLEINYTGKYLKAKTVWDVMKNFEALMVSAGKDCGQKTSVSVANIEQKDGKFRVEFFIESK